MKTAQIDVLSITKKGSIFTVEYWDESCNNENNVTMQISEDALVNHIVQNELNHETFINYRMQNPECDGMDERYINPFEYLADNTDFVLADYITANS